MNLKTVLANLQPEQKQQLLYALENSITQLIEFTPGFFVGVYVGSDFEIIETNGAWCVCRRKIDGV